MFSSRLEWKVPWPLLATRVVKFRFISLYSNFFVLSNWRLDLDCPHGSDVSWPGYITTWDFPHHITMWPHEIFPHHIYCITMWLHDCVRFSPPHLLHYCMRFSPQHLLHYRITMWDFPHHIYHVTMLSDYHITTWLCEIFPTTFTALPHYCITTWDFPLPHLLCGHVTMWDFPHNIHQITTLLCDCMSFSPPHLLHYCITVLPHDCVRFSPPHLPHYHVTVWHFSHHISMNVIG